MPRERRYPPSPYPPRTAATRSYRDGWDLGWQHMGTMGAGRARGYYDGMTDGPSKTGYRDGARARWAYERKVAAAEADARSAAREAQRAEWARAAEAEGAY
jgi:hypothetical protein